VPRGAPPPRRDAAPELAHPLPESQGIFAALIPPLRRAVAAQGYEKPTPIQEQAIPPLLAGRDLLGVAQTGTGKTAAFVLPILQYLDQHPKGRSSGRPRVLILAPTRELAAQIGESITAYGRYLRCPHAVIFGGVGQGPQVSALRSGVDLLVATPGRLLDLLGQRCLTLSEIEVFVLDEADRMLDMGFLPDIRRVLALLPARRHNLFFSATMPREVADLAATMVNNPVRVTIDPERPTVDRIGQVVLFVDRGNKLPLLSALLGDPAIDKVLVFTQMKHQANRVVEKLVAEGIGAAAIHSNKSQSARMHALAQFKAGRVRVLVATDIAARGIDIDGITHVINYDLPNVPETYVHRIGRTARAGAQGDAISFCAADERDFLRDIERAIRKQIPVETNHPYHSPAAQQATGAAAKPPPRAARGPHHGRGGPRQARPPRPEGAVGHAFRSRRPR
jgi:ATP-dependent RNA helicase RhlE